jgi:mono/diheme cytochrome c family protein
MYRSPRASRIAVALLAAVAATGVAAQQRPAAQRDMGKIEYETNCASCHGMQGKGDGPLKPFLTRSAPDLTQLARGNGGVLPVSRIYSVIEGSTEPSAHGTRDMPIWGREYKTRAAEYYQEMPYDPDTFVRARVLSLVDYIARLQAK